MKHICKTRIGDDYMFKNKVVLVTGSSRGIGRAIAYAFAANGASVIINAHSNKDALINTYNEFTAKGFNCHYIQADVSNYEEVSNMINETYSYYKKIDVLVNNAGISHIGLFSDLLVSDWNSIMSTNTTSLFNCCRNVVPNMISLKQGSIINISSIWGITGASCEVAYSASKGAVNAFTKALARELGPSNIRVNAIACGVIETDMNLWLNAEEKTALTDEITLMKFGKPEDVAKLALFLASDSSDFITGQIITLDGGMI